MITDNKTDFFFFFQTSRAFSITEDSSDPLWDSYSLKTKTNKLQSWLPVSSRWTLCIHFFYIHSFLGAVRQFGWDAVTICAALLYKSTAWNPPGSFYKVERRTFQVQIEHVCARSAVCIIASIDDCLFVAFNREGRGRDWKLSHQRCYIQLDERETKRSVKPVPSISKHLTYTCTSRPM